MGLLVPSGAAPLQTAPCGTVCALAADSQGLNPAQAQGYQERL